MTTQTGFPKTYPCEVCTAPIDWDKTECPLCHTTYEYEEGSHPTLPPQLQARIKVMLEQDLQVKTF